MLWQYFIAVYDSKFCFIQLLYFILNQYCKLFQLFILLNTLSIKSYLLITVVDQLDIHKWVLVCFYSHQQFFVKYKIFLTWRHQFFLHLKVLPCFWLKTISKNVIISNKKVTQLIKRFLVFRSPLDKFLELTIKAAEQIYKIWIQLTVCFFIWVEVVQYFVEIVFEKSVIIDIDFDHLLDVSGEVLKASLVLIWLLAEDCIVVIAE